MVRVCDFSCIKVFGWLRNAQNFRLAPLGARKKFLVSLGARAENGELALVKYTKVKSITRGVYCHRPSS